MKQEKISNRHYHGHSSSLTVENNRKYFHLSKLAQIQAGLGMNKEALITTKESLKKSKAAGAKAYIKSNEDFIEKLLYLS